MIRISPLLERPVKVVSLQYPEQLLAIIHDRDACELMTFEKFIQLVEGEVDRYEPRRPDDLT
jgi:hypothetical protein